MRTIRDSVSMLSDRLPELVWKLGNLQGVFNPKRLPRGLFNEQLEMTPQSCIDEIYADLKVLNNHKNERIAHYLAERVSQKINVLVRLCQIETRKKPSGALPTFGVQTMSTRQQWLSGLQDDIARLSAQHQALSAALSKQQAERNPQVILTLQADLGELERRLTLAKETLARAMVY